MWLPLMLLLLDDGEQAVEEAGRVHLGQANVHEPTHGHEFTPEKVGLAADTALHASKQANRH